MTRKRTFLYIATILTIALLCSAFSCSDWERRTFQTLSADKGIIDQAVADYNTGAIAQTTVNRDLIDKGRKIHDTAVKQFAEYWSLKTRYQTALANHDPNGPTSAAVDAARQTVLQAMTDLPGIVAQIKALAAKK